MIGIGRTDGPKELAEIYSASNVLFNASVEETFGLPNVELLRAEHLLSHITVREFLRP